jgi:DNA-binding GntR family transcriptional regulator
MAGSTLRDGVHKALLDLIVSGGLQPGEKLGEVRLAAELSVSRTPVREAIRHLSEEGFVEYAPHCGARVTVPTAQSVREMFQIREALEGIAAREAASRIEWSRVEQLRARFEDLRVRVRAGDTSDVGDSIHEETFRASGNQMLERLMGLYRLKISWFQRMAAQVPGRLAHAFREHDSILSALESRDPEWAESVARAHVRNTLNDLLPALSRILPEAEE